MQITLLMIQYLTIRTIGGKSKGKSKIFPETFKPGLFKYVWPFSEHQALKGSQFVTTQFQYSIHLSQMLDWDPYMSLLTNVEDIL